ncbi:MAG: hypothetical protein ACI9EW_000190 [Cellvibrionaceae bacterium]|jgi:hypothetical protein
MADWLKKNLKTYFKLVKWLEKFLKLQMNDRQFVLLGWFFFIISALFFLAVGIRSGDWLTILGALFFLLANIVFLVPVLRNNK